MNKVYNMISPKKIESKNIMRNGNFVGLGILLLFGIQLFGSTIFMFILSFVKGISFVDASKLMESDVFIAYGINTVLCAICFIFPLWLSSKLCGHKIRDIGGFGASRYPKVNGLCISLALGFTALGNIAAVIMSMISTVFFNTQLNEPTIGDGTYTIIEFLFMIFSVAVAPAFLEEFAFRGVVFGCLKKFGDWPAIIVSSLLFGFIHGNFVQIPFAFFVGLGLGILRSITGSIWPCVLVHFINNFAASIMSVAPKNAVALMNIYYIIFCLAIGLYAFVKLRKINAFSHVDDVPSCMSKRERTLRLIVSPTVIISILIFLALAVVYNVCANLL